MLAILLMLSFASCSIGVAPSRAATAPTGFYGLGGWSYPSAAQATTLGNAGVRSYRAGLVWNDVEPQPGQRNWNDVDRLMTNAGQSGYDVLLVLNGCARWACGATRVAPTEGPQMDAFTAFVTAAVQRYGSGGDFWKSHAALPQPTVSWQVWNEVNTGADWPNPTAAGYAGFLKAVGATIKVADPQSTVVASGLTEHPAVASGVPGKRFLDQLYDQPGFTSSFDVAAVHAYAEDTVGSVRILDSMRQVMLSHGDADRPMWVTEMGWADGGPPHPFVRDSPGQAAELRQSFDTFLGCRARWKLDRVMWFSVQDLRPEALGEADYWGLHTGLLTADGTPKPAFDAFKAYVNGAPLGGGRGDACGLPGGAALDVRGPDTSITDSPKVVGKGRRAAVSFDATEAGRFECALDGSGWSPCVTPSQVARTREGSHEIFVRAVDAQGNVDPTPARARWVVDLTPPDTRITRRPPAITKTRVIRIDFKGKDAVGTRSFQCRADNAKWLQCASPYRSPRTGAGRHRVSIRAIDHAGNVQVRPTVVRYTITTAARRAKARAPRAVRVRPASTARRS